MEKESPVEKPFVNKTRELRGFWYFIAVFIALGIAFYQIFYAPFFGLLPVFQLRSILWSLTVVLMFIYFPALKTSPRNKATTIDIVCALGSIVVGMYFIFSLDTIADRIGAPVTADIVLGVLFVILVLEAGRRVVGVSIVIIARLFMVYAGFIGVALIYPGYFFILAALLVVPLIHYQILQEEQFLEKHYRNKYLDYKSRVRCYL